MQVKNENKQLLQQNHEMSFQRNIDIWLFSMEKYIKDKISIQGIGIVVEFLISHS